MCRIEGVFTHNWNCLATQAPQAFRRQGRQAEILKLLGLTANPDSTRLSSSKIWLAVNLGLFAL